MRWWRSSDGGGGGWLPFVGVRSLAYVLCFLRTFMFLDCKGLKAFEALGLYHGFATATDLATGARSVAGLAQRIVALMGELQQ